MKIIVLDLFGCGGDSCVNREDAEMSHRIFLFACGILPPAYRPGKGAGAWMITIARNMADGLSAPEKRRYPWRNCGEDLHHSQPSCGGKDLR